MKRALARRALGLAELAEKIERDGAARPMLVTPSASVRVGSILGLLPVFVLASRDPKVAND